MNEWKDYKLGELCEIKGGKRLPSGHELTNAKTKHPYIKARDIKNGRISVNNLEYITEYTHEIIKRYIVKENDVCLTIVANIGDVGIVPKELNNANLTENAVRLTNISKNLHPKYLNYLLSSPTYKMYCEGLAAGAAQSKLGIYKIKTINLRLPDYLYQHRIASILFAYDQLIETNHRRIVLLDKMAEQIYKEWFVRMRFPGHENTEFEKGVPKGWKVVKLKNILKLSYGKSLLESDRDGGEYPVFGSSGIVGQHSEWLVEGPGIIVGRKGNVGSIFYCESNFYPIDTVYFVESKYPFSYLFFLLQTVNFISGDAAVPGLNREQAYSNKIYLPSNELILLFDKLIQPIFQQKLFIKRQNHNLKQTRDLLLPRLISGKLKEPEAKKELINV